MCMLCVSVQIPGSQRRCFEICWSHVAVGSRSQIGKCPMTHLASPLGCLRHGPPVAQLDLELMLLPSSEVLGV